MHLGMSNLLIILGTATATAAFFCFACRHFATAGLDEAQFVQNMFELFDIGSECTFLL